MNIYEVLHDEHEYVLGLLEKLEEARPTERKELLQEVAAALVPHTKAEEQTLYALLREVRETKDKVGEAFEEHHITNVTLSELLALDVEDDAFEAKAKVLHELVSHHVQEEESELFPSAKQIFDEAVAEGMAGEFLATKQELLEGPSLLARGKETLLKLVENVTSAVRP